MNLTRSFWIAQFSINRFFILFLLFGPLQLSVANQFSHIENTSASIQEKFLNIMQTNTTTLPTSLVNSSATSSTTQISTTSSDGYGIDRPYPPECSGDHWDESLCSDGDDNGGDNNDDNSDNDDDNGDDDNDNNDSPDNVSNCTNTVTSSSNCFFATNGTTTIPSWTPLPGYESIPPNPYSASVSFSLVAGVIIAALLVGSCVLCACRLAARDRRRAIQRLRSRRQGSDIQGLWSEDDNRSAASIMTEPLPVYVGPSSDEELRPPPKYENVFSSHDLSEGSGTNEV